jgi:hypothetical protein
MRESLALVARVAMDAGKLGPCGAGGHGHGRARPRQRGWPRTLASSSLAARVAMAVGELDPGSSPSNVGGHGPKEEGGTSGPLA